MKWLWTVLAAGICSGCVTYTQNGEVRRTIFVQNGIALQVFNQCTEDAGRVYPSTGGTYTVPSGPPKFIPLIPAFLLNTQYVAVTYQVYRGDVQLGSVSRSFYIERSGTASAQWIIGGNSSGGGNNVYVDHVYGSDGRRIC